MLIVAEASGIDDATYNFRTLLSEHRLEFWTVEKNSITGRLETREVKREGPTGLITTTTLSGIHPENETRLLSLAVDDSEEHTIEAKEAIADKYLDSGPDPDLEPYRNIQRVLGPVKVRIPYAKFLAEHTPKTPGRILRDLNKLLILVEAAAVLPQQHRGHHDDGAIEAKLADYYVAKTIAEEALVISLYGLHPNTLKIIEAIKVLSAKRRNGSAIPVDEVIISTDELADYLGRAKSTISKWNKPLDEYGWIVHEGQKNYYRIGREIPFNRSFLPPVEAVAEAFPNLARDFQIIDPITGKEIVLRETPAVANRDPGDPITGKEIILKEETNTL